MAPRDGARTSVLAAVGGCHEGFELSGDVAGRLIGELGGTGGLECGDAVA